jgi:hypothetical protein
MSSSHGRFSKSRRWAISVWQAYSSRSLATKLARAAFMYGTLDRDWPAQWTAQRASPAGYTCMSIVVARWRCSQARRPGCRAGGEITLRNPSHCQSLDELDLLVGPRKRTTDRQPGAGVGVERGAELGVCLSASGVQHGGEEAAGRHGEDHVDDLGIGEPLLA